MPPAERESCRFSTRSVGWKEGWETSWDSTSAKKGGGGWVFLAQQKEAEHRGNPLRIFPYLAPGSWR